MEEKKPQPFVVNGREYPVPEDFTLGEMCDAEQYFGVDFSDPAASRMRVIAASMYVAIRRVDPTVTVDDVREIPQETLLENMRNMEDDAGPPERSPSSDEPSSESELSGVSSINGGGDPASVPIATGQPS